jgi:hypothetical protein
MNKCDVIKCTAPAAHKGLCHKHYMRKYRHGTTDATRPIDWGAREKHPLYTTWCSIRRNRPEELCEEWTKDFWSMVQEVKFQPEGQRQKLERMDETKTLGPGNWYWRSFKKSPTDRAKHKEYMREYSQKQRDANPDYFWAAELKRRYGTTIEWYNQKLVEQGGVCAMCKKPETLVIKGVLQRLAVDHCHEHGHVRGLLCSKCNRGIGLLNHDTGILRAGIEYLEKYPATTNQPQPNSDPGRRRQSTSG